MTLLEQALADVAALLDAARIPYILIGGPANSFVVGAGPQAGPQASGELPTGAHDASSRVYTASRDHPARKAAL